MQNVQCSTLTKPWLSRTAAVPCLTAPFAENHYDSQKHNMTFVQEEVNVSRIETDRPRKTRLAKALATQSGCMAVTKNSYIKAELYLDKTSVVKNGCSAACPKKGCVGLPASAHIHLVCTDGAPIGAQPVLPVTHLLRPFS